MIANTENTFKYFAFISYSRKDSRAAAFVQRRLERFRIPIKRVPEESREGLGKFVRPVFRDKRDLEVGESSFTEDIKSALAESRFLIVICSPNSAQSKWVDKEVEYFLSTHGCDLSKIVPVVLSGDPDSGDETTECLCEHLRSEKIGASIVSRNLPTMIPDEGENDKVGWEMGVVGVLSYMLKVRRQDIKATIDAEKVRQMRIYAVIGVVCSAIFALLAFWAVRAERTARRNWRLAEDNKKQAIEQRDRAVEAEKLADKNRRKAEENEKRALAGENAAREKAFLAEKTVDFLKRMLQEARPDEHGSKNIIDLLAEQQSKVDLLVPPELRYSVSLTLGQIMLEQSLFLPASRMLKYAYDFSKVNENKMGKEASAGAANLLALAYNNIPGRSAEALTLLSEAEEFRRQQGVRDSSMANTYFNMALSYFAKNDYAKSRELCDKVLLCTEGKPCVATLRAISQNASIALELSEYEKAEELCEKAFQISAEMHEEPDGQLLETFVLAKFRNGKYDIAKKTAEDALAKLRGRGGVTPTVFGLENNLGLIADAKGDTKKAIEHYQNAINCGEKIWPDGHGNLAKVISNLGAVYQNAGAFLRAISLFSRAVEMLEKLEGKDSWSLYTPLVNLGVAYKENRDYSKAIGVLERAYGICIRKFGPDAAQLSGVIFHIADVKALNGQREEAKAGHEEALRILRLHNQSETELAIGVMGNLAVIYAQCGVKVKSKELFDEAVRLARKVLPVGNYVRQSVMRAYENTVLESSGSSKDSNEVSETNWNAKKSEASKAISEGRNDTAETLYLELLHYLESTERCFTTEYALVCNQLGILAERKEDLRSALMYYIKSRDTDFSIRGTNDMSVAITCKNMAGVLRRLGDVHGEELSLLRALPAYESVSGSDHAVSVIYTDLGRIKAKQEMWNESIAWYQKALDYDIRNKGANSIDVAIDHEDIGDLQVKVGDFAGSIESYQAAIDIRRGVGEAENSEKMGHLSNELGNAFWKVKRYSEALTNYRRAYKIDFERLGLTNGNTVVVLGNLGGAEIKVGDYTNAIKHLTLAANMKKSMKEFDAHDYGYAMNDLALAYSGNGDSDSALRTYAVALEYYIKAHGRENENVMIVHSNIASESAKRGRNDDAIINYRKALDVALLLYGERNETTRQFYRDLGDCLYSAGKYDKCAAIRKKYLDVVSGDTHLEPCFAAKAHSLYADALVALDDYENAASNMFSAVTMYRKSGNKFLKSVAVTLCELGTTLRKLGDFKLAVESFSEAKRLFDDNNFTYAKGGLVDLGICKYLDECRGVVAGQLVPVVKMIKIVPGGQAERLGVCKDDIWCSLDEWRAADYPGGRGLWSSLVKFMECFKGKQRRLTVYRRVDGKWTQLTFLFDGSLGGFVYGYDVISDADRMCIEKECGSTGRKVKHQK